MSISETIRKMRQTKISYKSLEPFRRLDLICVKNSCIYLSYLAEIQTIQSTHLQSNPFLNPLTNHILMNIRILSLTKTI